MSHVQYDSMVVYGLKRVNNAEIRYVGQTRLGALHRFQVHVRTARAGSRSHYPLYAWMTKHVGDIEFVELSCVQTPEDLDAAEVYWINKLREDGNALLNVDPGGSGVHRYSPEKNAKCGQRGENHYNYGKKHSEETKQKLSAARKLRVVSDESRERYREGCLKSLGDGHGKCKVNEAIVREIRAMREEGNTLKVIAETYDITEANVSLIVRRKTWGHVE